MAYNDHSDFVKGAFTFKNPGAAVERRSVSSGSVAEFTAKIEPQFFHEIHNESVSVTAYVSFNGTDPVILNGSGSNHGIPVAPGEKLPAQVPSDDGAQTLKATCDSTTHLTLIRFPNIAK